MGTKQREVVLHPIGVASLPMAIKYLKWRPNERRMCAPVVVEKALDRSCNAGGSAALQQ